MEKRLFLAIALSLLVLISWQVFGLKSQIIVPQEVINANPALLEKHPLQDEDFLKVEKLISYPQDNLEVVFNEPLAAIKEINFKNYHSSFFLKYAFLLKDPHLTFHLEKLSDKSITFSALLPAGKIIKKFTFYPNYAIELELIMQNNSSQTLHFNLPLVLGVLNWSSANPQSRYQDLTAGTEDKILRFSGRQEKQLNNLKFLGLRNQYFTTIIGLKEKTFFNGFINKLNNEETEVKLNVQTEIKPQSQIGHFYIIYIGPQDIHFLNQVNPDWTNVIHYGTFDFIAQILIQLLTFFYKLVHNWGLAIIFLSILVYFCLYPLSLKQMLSLKKMQELQPKIEELRKIYKDNPQRLNKEIMELYREYKVNPLGGCLPLLLQLPIFFALYNALMRSILLKGARFLWIKDLAEPDKFLLFPRHWPTLPVLGREINLLPILMAIGIFLQQKISSWSLRANTPSAEEQQKIMLVLMPILLGFIFYRMPAGLVIYWLINSILMLIFQWRMRR